MIYKETKTDNTMKYIYNTITNKKKLKKAASDNSNSQKIQTYTKQKRPGIR